MRPKAHTDIDAVLSAYVIRKADHEREIVNGAAWIQGIKVSGTLDRIASDLIRQGFSARVAKSDQVSAPTWTTLTIAVPRSEAEAWGAILRFECTANGEIIVTRSGLRASGDSDIAHWLPVALSGEWFRDQALRFVESVLDEIG
jgi:hypothetical protein